MFSKIENAVINLSDYSAAANDKRYDTNCDNASTRYHCLDTIDVEMQEISLWLEGGDGMQTQALSALMMNNSFIEKLWPVDAYVLGVMYSQQYHDEKTKALAYMRKVYSLAEKHLPEIKLKIEQKKPVNIMEHYDAGIVSRITVLSFCGQLKLEREITTQELVDNPALFIGLNSEQSFQLGYVIGKTLH